MDMLECSSLARAWSRFRVDITGDLTMELACFFVSVAYQDDCWSGPSLVVTPLLVWWPEAV